MSKYRYALLSTHSNFSLSFCLYNTGTRESNAKAHNIIILFQDHASLDDVNLCNVCPACIATNDGGATPKNVPTVKGTIGTPITGLAKFINQLGKSGVILRNNI